MICSATSFKASAHDGSRDDSGTGPMMDFSATASSGVSRRPELEQLPKGFGRNLRPSELPQATAQPSDLVNRRKHKTSSPMKNSAVIRDTSTSSDPEFSVVNRALMSGIGLRETDAILASTNSRQVPSPVRSRLAPLLPRPPNNPQQPATAGRPGNSGPTSYDFSTAARSSSNNPGRRNEWF